LEFHQELLEDGNELDVLKKQFGSPPPSGEIFNVTPEVVKLPDNIEAALKEKDDRLTLLEYELRMAKQNNNVLREKLTKVQSNPLKPSFSGNSPAKIGSRTEIVGELEKDGIREQELRVINYLVMRYLLTQGYKVSAIAFEEEVTDQAVSDWESVGINSPSPPSLVTYLRYFNNVDPSVPRPIDPNVKSANDALIASLKEELEQSKKKLLKLEEKHSTLKKKFDKLLVEKKNVELALESLGTKIDVVSKDVNTQLPVEQIKKKTKHRRPYTEVDPNPFNITEETENSIRISGQLKSIASDRDSQSLVHIFSDAIPYIVPGVILKRREEIIPIIICAISQHPDSNSRCLLTQILFNLIKRPNEHERKILVEGFETLAKIIGEESTERELLPQCWEQIHDEHDERRVLVADSCGAIAKYVRAELRPSLLLSILQQLSQDKSHIVRQAVSRNMGILVSYFEGNEKYSQVEDMLFELLNDSEDTVRLTTQRVLLPIFVDWADEFDLLETKLLTKFLSEIEATLAASDDQRLIILFNSFQSIIPRIRESILFGCSIENPPEDFVKLMQSRKDKLDQFFDSDSLTGGWNELDWFINTCSSKFVMFTTKLDFSNPKVAQGFVGIFSTFVSVFGENFGTITLKKLFEPYLSKDQRGKVLPLYLAGVVAYSKKKDLSVYIKQILLNIALEESGWKRSHIVSLQDGIKLLCKLTERKEEILNLLWELVVHTASSVRSAIVHLFEGLITVLHNEEIMKRILPALITLAADPDITVKIESIQALGILAINVEDTGVLDKIKLQLNVFMEEDNYNSRTTITKVFTNMIPHIQAHFRDYYILPNIVTITEKNAKTLDIHQRASLAQLLFESYRAYTGCLIDEESVNKHLLPGLKLLLRDADVMDPAYRTMISTMISEIEGTKQGPIDNNTLTKGTVPPSIPVVATNQPKQIAPVNKNEDVKTKAFGYFDKMRKGVSSTVANATGTGVPPNLASSTGQKH